MSSQAAVREKYGSVARSVSNASAVACCDPALRCCDPITKNLYGDAEKGVLPEKAVLASLGCGNPTALIELKPGETVLDLGSGGGIDVLLSARRVGPGGKAYGLDMTDDMLALARENQKQAGATNVEFLKGEIENIPLPDASVDVVISNCVINLSSDKSRVLREAFRVLRPGGRFAVSDVVVRGKVPDAVRSSMLLWVGCIAGALEESDYRAKLLAAGNTALALLANSLATGGVLVAIILAFGPVSGAHLNPAVTLADAWMGGIRWRETPLYVIAQTAGAFAGVGAADRMFGLATFSLSTHVRSGASQALSEFVATFGLLCVIWGCVRTRPAAVPFAVGAYITGAYWFTASTSFANPAVTVARSFTDTFAGIRLADAPVFVAAQLAGAFAATVLFRWLLPSTKATDVLVRHDLR
ncbi:MAG: hypothetical protein NVSMB62_11750 [Acidobacteriaceae bacterium]